MSFEISTGDCGMLGGLTGRLCTALECWPRSWNYVACRSGRSRKHGTVCVYVCVVDALGSLSVAMSLVDGPSGVTSRRKYKNHNIHCR